MGLFVSFAELNFSPRDYPIVHMRPLSGLSVLGKLIFGQCTRGLHDLRTFVLINIRAGND